MTHAGGPRVVAVDPVAPTRVTLQAAVDVLRAGGLVAFPTETFYGLAASALDPAAVRRIFELKGRPESKPLLVLVDSVAMAETVAHVAEPARDLMGRYWPGALTLVLRARAHVPPDVTARSGTLGLRVSSHRSDAWRRAVDRPRYDRGASTNPSARGRGGARMNAGCRVA